MHHTCTHIHLLTHTYTFTYTYAQTHTYVYALTYTRTPTHTTRMPIDTFTRLHCHIFHYFMYTWPARTSCSQIYCLSGQYCLHQFSMRSSADAWTMQPTTVEAVSVAIAFSNVKPYGHHTNLKIHCQVYIAKLRSNISCAPAAFIRLLTVLTNFIRIYANNTLSYDNQANGHEGCCRNIYDLRTFYGSIFY